MDFLKSLENASTVENTKGGKYYSTTYNANLDMFTGITRFQDYYDLIAKFERAIAEDKTLALANLLYLLDIRHGKGARYVFKALFEYLCENERDMALKILPFISELGRWDYVLVGLDTTIDKEVVLLIKKTLEEDKSSDAPTLLAKWLPSHRTHNMKNQTAKKLMKKLGMSEEEYRKTLTQIRKKLNLIENNLTKRDYHTIDFEKVPTKAMLKYDKAFRKRCIVRYDNYLQKVKNNKAKINTTGLYCYEIVLDILKSLPINQELYDLMWKNQLDVLKGTDKNILVMADTSGSMESNDYLPLATSIGLAIYIAERNNGFFKNYFITFSDTPILQKVVGSNIWQKVKNIQQINKSTNIDAAFKLLLDTAVENNIKQEEFPSHIIIVSDMEFDSGVYSENGTNLSGWKKAFKDCGYEIPKIIFWNVSCDTYGLPATKNEENIIMVSGFSTYILDSLLDLENYTPMCAMMQKLQKYIDMLEVV